MKRASLVVALLVAPTAVGYFAASPAIRSPGLKALQPRLASRVGVPALAASDDAAEAYRLLGLSDDAEYDKIWEAYEALSEKYAADPARVSTIEEAKDKVLDDRLRQRMAGTLGATYDGMVAVEDRPEEPKTPLLEILSGYRKKLILVPSPRYAFQVFTILGGLTLATWVAPSTAGSILLINIMSGMGFIYNRGEADVVRDDFGQIGEIRPMKPKPFMLTAAIAASISLFGWLRAKKLVAGMVAAGATVPRGLDGVLRTTLISCGLIIPSLFVKVHSIFDY